MHLGFAVKDGPTKLSYLYTYMCIQCHVNCKLIHILFFFRAGQSPSAYVMYQFYAFPDHDTPIVPYSTEPHFSDDRVFPVSMDTHLDGYLKKQVYMTTYTHGYTSENVPNINIRTCTCMHVGTPTLALKTGHLGGSVFCYLCIHVCFPEQAVRTR